MPYLLMNHALCYTWNMDAYSCLLCASPLADSGRRVRLRNRSGDKLSSVGEALERVCNCRISEKLPVLVCRTCSLRINRADQLVSELKESTRNAFTRHLDLSPESALCPQKRYHTPRTSPLAKRSAVGSKTPRTAQVPARKQLFARQTDASNSSASSACLCTESPQTPSQSSRIPVRVLRQSSVGIDEATTTVKVLFSAITNI